jgi:TolA-binding protein
MPLLLVKNARREIDMMDKKVLIVAVGCLLWLAAASGVALGQAAPAKGAEPEAKIPDDPKVIRDMAPTALAEKNYKLAVALYSKLVERYPKNLDYRYSYGLSLMGADNKNDAEKVFNEVLNMDPDNLNAFFQLARLNALRGGKKNMQKARDYLKQAARQGYAAISAIYNFRELKPFEAEVKFMLELLEVAKFDYQPMGQDPFHNPLPRKQEKGKKPPVVKASYRDRIWTEELQKQYLQDVDILMKEMEEALTVNDRARVNDLFPKIQELLGHGKKVTVRLLQQRLERLKDKLKEKETIIKAIQLKAFFKEGETILAKMENKLKEADFEAVFSGNKRLEQHAKDMIETDKEFTDAANSLKTKGSKLVAQARKLKRAHDVARGLSITGILGGKGIAPKAIINDNIYNVGEYLLDAEGNLLKELKVVGIEKNAVRLKYIDVEFDVKMKR